MFFYYVFYQHREGFGSIEISRTREVESYDDVNSLACTIEEHTGFKGVCVTNYKPMKRPSKNLKAKLIASGQWEE